MTETTKHVYVETVSWMKPVKDERSGETGLMIGRVQNTPNTLAVMVTLPTKTTATRFYCEQHQRIYHFQQTCPDCVLQPGQ